MIKTKRLLDFFCKIVEIPSPSFSEEKFKDYMVEVFSPFCDEIIQQRTPLGTHLLIRFNGSSLEQGIIFCAHMDTVETGDEKIKPVVDGDTIWSSGNTILGADDKSAIAMMYEALKAAKENGTLKKSVDLLLSFGEEKHLAGIKEFDFSALRYKEALLLDASGSVGGIVLSSPTHYNFCIEVSGKKAHAGIEPENGVNAIRKASEIILSLPQGRINENSTFNVGMIEGGEATNIVPDFVKITGEFRSIVKEDIQMFLKELNNLRLKFDDLKIDIKQNYKGYVLNKEDSFFKEIENKIKAIDLKLYYEASGGGSDANVLREHEINAVNLCCGMTNAHTTDEFIRVDDLIKGSELLLSFLI